MVMGVFRKEASTPTTIHNIGIHEFPWQSKSKKELQLSEPLSLYLHGFAAKALGATDIQTAPRSNMLGIFAAQEDVSISPAVPPRGPGEFVQLWSHGTGLIITPQK